MGKTRPKDIGTAGETAVRNYLLSLGFSELEAHRNVLSGAQDRGDVWLRLSNELIVFEVKSGHTAENASLNQCALWMIEAERERYNAGGALAILVTKRKGVGVARAGEWWAYITLADSPLDGETMFRATLSDVLDFRGLKRLIPDASA